jgi:predicted nuclease of restriction endonuclease-like (RecB) superfamily
MDDFYKLIEKIALQQMNSRLFERTMISDEKNKSFMTKSPVLSALRDNYALEFLDIPESHKEVELRFF